MLDNSSQIRCYVPERYDGDTFIYTELLDRTKGKGNNGHRIVKTFYHRSQEEYDSQLPEIKRIADLMCIRAYTRIAPRSFRKIGMAYTKMVVDAALTANWAGLKTLYAHAAATTKPNESIWAFDVDDTSAPNVPDLWNYLKDRDLWLGDIPSKRGVHILARPHQAPVWLGITMHKDNPTNLYIPDGAA